MKIFTKLRILLILGNAGLSCMAQTSDKASLFQEPQHQEPTGCTLLNQEITSSLKDMQDMQLELSVVPKSCQQEPMDCPVAANEVPLSASVPLPSYYYVDEDRKYLGVDQLFYEIELASDHDVFGVVFNGLGILLNHFLYEHERPCLFATRWILYAPPLKENGDPVVSFKRTLGFKLKDLMHYFRTGGKIGWTGGLNSCFGVYGQVYYEHRRHDIRLQHEDEHTSSWTNSLLPGIGIRFTPQFWTDEDEYNPYIEIGTTYTHIFGCKSRYGRDKDQFGHGLTYSFGIGVRGNGMNRNTKVFVGFELPKYDYFNRKWSNDGGYYFPYANIRDRRWRISINISVPF